MPTFKPKKSTTSVIPDGVYVTKIIAAEERCSGVGNDMLVMTLRLPTGEALPCILTFVKKARTAINCFCDSAQLLRPDDPEADVELTAADCLNRYLYVGITNDNPGPVSDPYPHVSRFLTREAALVKNPQLATIVLEDQKPLELRRTREQTLTRSKL
jgi:hypothetical protein